MKDGRSLLSIPLLAVALLLAAGFAVFIGPTRSLDPVILLEIRVPRVVLGVITGIALATAGALFQGLLRNPLADPYILGTSGGAALGVIAGSALRTLIPGWAALSTAGYYALIFIGAFAATSASYLIARTERNVSPVNLLLAGAIVSALCGSLIFLFFTLRSEDSFSMLFFLMGGLVEMNRNLIGISAALILAGCGASLLVARSLNILSLGEEKAKSLGVRVERLKFAVFCLASLIVSAAVAVAGPIGFVGLIVPHAARLIVGPNHRVLIPTSALAGGILLVLTDALARTVARPVEIPVGVITAMFGAPFFLWLLRRKRKSTYF